MEDKADMDAPGQQAMNVALVTKTLVHNGAAVAQGRKPPTLATLMDFCSLCEAVTILDNLSVVESSDTIPKLRLSAALSESGILEEFRPAVSRTELRRLALRLPEAFYRQLPPAGEELVAAGDVDLRDDRLIGDGGEILGVDYERSLERLATQIEEMVKYPSLRADGPDLAARVLRSNGYLLVASANGLDYFPDYDRVPFVASTVRTMYRSLPRQLYENVARALDLSESGTAKELLVHEWTLDMTVPIPPVAALVLHRSRSVKDIPLRLLEVRDEFAPFRRNFRDFRSELQAADSVAERKKLQRRYQQLLAASSGDHHEAVSMTEALGFAENLVKVGVAPASPTSYSAALLTQPIEWLRRWWQRRPLTVLFRMDSKLPRLHEYRTLVKRLWGESIAESVLDEYAVHAGQLSRLLAGSSIGSSA